VVAVIGSLWRARPASNVTTYGSARWTTKAEARRAGLFGLRGVFPGQLGGRYLRHDGAEHVMAFAPTRSGKGVGLVIPTLLSWTGSADHLMLPCSAAQPLNSEPKGINFRCLRGSEPYDLVVCRSVDRSAGSWTDLTQAADDIPRHKRDRRNARSQVRKVTAADA
jgi:hypothetical protein